MEILFNLTSFFALFSAFNFAYAGVTRLREVLTKDLLKIEELITKANLIFTVWFETSDPITPEEKAKIIKDEENKLAEKLKSTYRKILKEREKHSKFEEHYIEMFFSAGLFCAFHVLWFSFRNEIDKDLFLFILSCSYLIVLPMLYVYLSELFSWKTISVLTNVIIILSISVSIVTAYFLIKLFNVNFPHFSENICILLSITISLLPYAIYFAKACLHLYNNKRALKKCLDIKMTMGNINDAFRNQFFDDFFKE